jgi:hypothetical protein
MSAKDAALAAAKLAGVPTLAQVVEAGYTWANGDRPRETFCDPDEIEAVARGAFDRAPEVDDSFFDFILREAVGAAGEDGIGTIEAESPEHWAEVIRRMEQVSDEVDSIIRALERFRPKPRRTRDKGTGAKRGK